MNKLLTIKEVAELLNISVVTVRRIMKRHEIVYYKLGGSIRFKQQDVESYLSQQKKEVNDGNEMRTDKL